MLGNGFSWECKKRLNAAVSGAKSQCVQLIVISGMDSLGQYALIMHPLPPPPPNFLLAMNLEPRGCRMFPLKIIALAFIVNPDCCLPDILLHLTERAQTFIADSVIQKWACCRENHILHLPPLHLRIS